MADMMVPTPRLPWLDHPELYFDTIEKLQLFLKDRLVPPPLKIQTIKPHHYYVMSESQTTWAVVNATYTGTDTT